MLSVGGASLGPAINDPLLDSQLRFLGAICAGWGGSMIWVARDIVSRRVPILLLSGTLLLGGVGRVVSAVTHGAASPVVSLFIAIEFGLPLLVLATAGRARPYPDMEV